MDRRPALMDRRPAIRLRQFGSSNLSPASECLLVILRRCILTSSYAYVMPKYSWFTFTFTFYVQGQEIIGNLLFVIGLLIPWNLLFVICYCLLFICYCLLVIGLLVICYLFICYCCRLLVICHCLLVIGLSRRDQLVKTQT